jgi:hypothetical protein
VADASTSEFNELIKRSEQLRSAVLALVVTYGTISTDEDERYRARREWIEDECYRLGLEHPFVWENARELLAWGKRIGKYDARRRKVEEMVQPFLDAVARRRDLGRVEGWSEAPDEWAEVQRRVSSLGGELDDSTELDDYQDVGRRAREVVKDAINVVFTDEMVPSDKPQPQADNAKERLSMVLVWYVPGSSHERFRTAMNAALSLANHVTHSRSTTRIEAFAAAQSALLVVRTLAEMRRMGPPAATGT